MRLTALALLLVLGACASGSGDPEPSASTTAPAVDPAASPTTPAPTGKPVPSALSRFRCDPDGAGTYVASGVLSNKAKAAVTFQVTVFVGQPVEGRQSAKTKQVPKVAAGGSVEFQIDQVPAVEGGTCHVQVITTK
jgi:hypothetical protein